MEEGAKGATVLREQGGLITAIFPLIKHLQCVRRLVD